MYKPRLHKSATISAAVIATMAFTACGSSSEGGATGSATEIQMWSHMAGDPGQLEVLKKIVADFNSSQDKYVLKEKSFPQDSYNDSVAAAALASDLPCLLDADGPQVPNWAWAGYLQPLGLPKEETDKLLPSAHGTYKDELYTVGYWDDTLGLFSRKSILEKHGIRIATAEKPWSLEEFEDALTKLKEAGYKYPFNLGTGKSGEWWSYAYAPLLQSAGGDLIDRDTYKSSDGVLNSPESVEWGEWFQGLFTKGFADKAESEAREGFAQGTVPLTYDGSWKALANLKTFGDDLVMMPPPDLGNGPKVSGASWQWGLSSACTGAEAEGAREYLKFSLKPEYIAAFSDLAGKIPATDEGAKQSKHYGPDGQLAFYKSFTEDYGVLRPATPAYPFISSTVRSAFQDIMNGANVKQTLDKAAQEIDANIKSNGDYGF